VGDIWMTTVRGLVRLEPSAARVRISGVRNCLPIQDFADQTIHISRAGHFAIGTGEGLLLFHPGDVRTPVFTPPLVIESIQVRRGDETVQFPVEGPVELEDGDRSLRVTARLRSFTDARAHRYRFRLE